MPHAHKCPKEAILGVLSTESYLYGKTGLFEHLRAYIKAKREALRVGLKPEEVPFLNSLKTQGGDGKKEVLKP